MLDPLELDTGSCEPPEEGDRNETQVPCKNSKFSTPLTHLSRAVSGFFGFLSYVDCLIW